MITKNLTTLTLVGLALGSGVAYAAPTECESSQAKARLAREIMNEKIKEFGQYGDAGMPVVDFKSNAVLKGDGTTQVIYSFLVGEGPTKTYRLVGTRIYDTKSCELKSKLDGVVE
jgi:hypothetical protein